jgi:arylsulfatase A-like enzyme
LCNRRSLRRRFERFGKTANATNHTQTAMHSKLTRRTFLTSAAALAARSQTPPPRPPNIVLVMTDDQGYGDIACLGNHVVKTPNLDKLHAESRRFTDFHVSPTCAPTRTALLTGRHEFRSGVTHTIFERERMSLQSTTLAQVLQSAGYSTGIFGKWHLGDADDWQPQKRGFSESFIHGCGGIGQDYPGTCSDAPGNTYFDPVIRHNGAFERTKGFCTDVFFGQALQWIEKQKSPNQPFFAYITPNAPHAPLFCPDEYKRMYAGQGLDDATQTYFGMVTNIDDNVGKLVSRLNAWGLDRNTLLIFMTDNGGTGGVKVFNAGMHGAKGTPWNGGTRVPAFFRWTGQIEPGDATQLAAHIDLLPTLAELAGAKIPVGIKLDGRSLVPVLRNAQAAWEDRFLFTHVGRWEKGKAAESQYAQCSVRSAQYTLVNTTREKQWQLFDLQADPGEKKNIASEKPDVVSHMDSAYSKWWKEILPALSNEDAPTPPIAPYKVAYWKQFGGGPGVVK